MGHCRSRFVTRFPANTSVQPQKFSRKSLYWYNLHVSYLPSILCTGNHVYLKQNKESEGEGEGYLALSSCVDALSESGYCFRALHRTLRRDLLSDQTANYVMGHTDHERRRLALQAAILNPLTDAFLRRAGISAGMNVSGTGMRHWRSLADCRPAGRPSR